MRLSLAKLLPHLNLPALRNLALALKTAGHTQEQIVEQVVAAIDATIDWSVLGPYGALIDAVDGPVAVAMVEFILSFRRHTPAGG